MNKDKEICVQCNGSSEGYSENSACKTCLGTGERPTHPYDITEEEIDDQD